jgi:hypothetical protein
MIDPRLKQGLEQCVADGRCRFMSYADFGREFNLGDNPRVWANKKVLDEIAAACREDPKIQLDLTFLLRNAETMYPSFIDGKPSKPPTPGQMLRAREMAQAIIDRFGLGTPNPY